MKTIQQLLIYSALALALFIIPNSTNAQYCTSRGSDASSEWIESVRFYIYDNISGPNSGYRYFDSRWKIRKGENMYFRLTPGYSGSAIGVQWNIWIDLNRDDDFDDTGELVSTVGGTTFSSPVRSSFTLPTSATTGYTRMRISMKRATEPSQCEIFPYGEVEDYRILIANPINYCSASGNSTSYEYIDEVDFDGPSTSITGDNGGYLDRTSTYKSVERDYQYLWHLRPGFPGSSYTEYWRVWADWNQDGDFDDIYETVFSGTTSGTTGTPMGLYIPNIARLGNTRIRVAMRWGGFPTSCGTFTYGEVEDYSLYIHPSGWLSFDGENQDDQAIAQVAPEIDEVEFYEKGLRHPIQDSSTKNYRNSG